MRSRAMLIALTLLAACQQQAEPAREPSVPASATAAPIASAAPASSAPAAQARQVKEESALYEFEYSYPAQAAAIPGLKARFDSDIDKSRADLVASAKGAKAEAGEAGIEYRAYARWIEWKVVTDLPGWLSLSAGVGEYTGGAHPNYWSDALLWDRTAGSAREPIELFVSKQALSRAIRAPFCQTLNRERSKRRGEPVDAAGDDPFNQCIEPTDYTVILGSSNRRVFDRIGILVPPYEAGSYAEGEYDVTLPVTPAVLAAVKPEFRASFAAR